MRRALAAALLGISLWIGSLAWSGFVMTRTVLDPNRSERVAETLLDNDAVRAQLVANIATGIEAGLPDGARVDRATLEAGAEQALDSPAARALVFDAFVRSHQAFLGEGEAPRSIDGGAFGAAARQSVVDANPALAGLIPEAPSFQVPLPTSRIPNLGPVRRGILTAIPILAGIAVVGSGLALVLTSNRPAIIRRTGIWAIGLSAFVLLFAYGVPALAQEVAPSQAEVVAALVAALAEATRGPALTLAGAGVAAVLVSLVWRPAAALATPDGSPPVAARAPQVASPAKAARQRRRDLPVPGRRPGATAPVLSNPPPVPPAGVTQSGSTPVRGTPAVTPSPAAPGGADSTRVQPAATDPTRVTPAASASPTATPPPTRENARWVDGHGWVHHGSDDVPVSAKWVPGVGYVLED